MDNLDRINLLRFTKYDSIGYIFDRDFMEQIRIEGFDKQEFVVQEKVHGSNTCFVTDGKTVHFGKRSGFIAEGEYFYEHEELLERYTSKIIALYFIVKERFKDMNILTIFGEMCGGNYPHPDVKNNTNVSIIQKGVFYSPNHEFYAFDLYVGDEKSGFYATVDESNVFFERGEFLYAKTLFRGTLDECLKYPNDSISLISDWLGLPPIENNICEGIVIRPVITDYLSNGARILLKSKNEHFLEKKAIKKRVPKWLLKHSYSEQLNNLLFVVEQYVTENRLNNVISKIGHVSMPKELGKLIDLFSEDILEDFLKENSGNFAVLEKNEQKIFSRHLRNISAKMIKEKYFKM